MRSRLVMFNQADGFDDVNDEDCPGGALGGMREQKLMTGEFVDRPSAALGASAMLSPPIRFFVMTRPTPADADDSVAAALPVNQFTRAAYGVAPSDRTGGGLVRPDELREGERILRAWCGCISL